MSYRGGYGGSRGGYRGGSRGGYGGVAPNNAPYGSDPRPMDQVVCGNPDCRQQGHYAVNCIVADAQGYTNGCGHCNNHRDRAGVAHTLHQCPILRDDQLTLPNVRQYILRKRDGLPPMRFDRDLQLLKDLCNGLRPLTRETAIKIYREGVDRRSLLVRSQDDSRDVDPAWDNGTPQIHPMDITPTPRPIVGLEPAIPPPPPRPLSYNGMTSFGGNDLNNRQFAPSLDDNTQAEIRRLNDELVRERREKESALREKEVERREKELAVREKEYALQDLKADFDKEIHNLKVKLHNTTAELVAIRDRESNNKRKTESLELSPQPPSALEASDYKKIKTSNDDDDEAQYLPRVKREQDNDPLSAHPAFPQQPRIKLEREDDEEMARFSKY